MNWIKNNYRRLFQYETLIVSIGNSNFRKLIKFTFFIVLVGQIGNLCANNKFPLFFIYQSAFLGILLLSYYSCMIIRKLIITRFLSFNIVVQYNSDTMDF